MKEGNETTEFKKTKSSTTFAYVGMVLAGILAIVPKLLGLVEEGSSIAIIGASVIAIIAIGQKCLVDLGYIKSRTEVKRAEAEVEMAKTMEKPSVGVD